MNQVPTEDGEIIVCEAGARAMAIAEIRDQILDCVGCYSALYVNKAWSERASRRLWREAPFRALSNIPKHRRDVYASNVHELFVESAEGIAVFGTWNIAPLRRLRVLSLHGTHSGPALFPPAGLVPNLRKLSVFHVRLPNDFLDIVCSKCPLLEVLRLSNPQWIVTPEMFGKFITAEESRSLSEVAFRDMDSVVKPNLAALCSSKNIKSLIFWMTLDYQSMEQIIQSSPEAFNYVDYLDCNITFKAARSLGNSQAPIQHATLRFQAGDGYDPLHSSYDVLDAITWMSHLTTLHLDFKDCPEPQMLCSRSLVSLSRLRNLTRLTISHFHNISKLYASGFDDAAFCSMVKTLPQIREFNFNILSDITIASLDALGSHCRFLEVVDMSPQQIDMRDLGTTSSATASVLFPNMTSLSVEMHDDYVFSELKDEGIVLHRHAPRLIRLYICELADGFGATETFWESADRWQ